MGCSASRLDTLLAKAIEDPSFSISSHNSSFSSSTITAPPSSSSSSSTNSSVIPKPRSLSTPLVHHPAIKKGDTHHLVSLTSTTYGSLIVVDNNTDSGVGCGGGGDDDFSEQSSPDSVINTWELMEGLEDEDRDFFDHKSFNLCDFEGTQKIPTLRLGLNVVDSVKKLSDSYVIVEMPQRNLDDGEMMNSNLNSKPLWKLLSEESLLSKMDPNVASSYQRALSAKSLGYNNNNSHNNDNNLSSRMNESVGSSPFVSKIKSVDDSSPMVSKSCGDGNGNVGEVDGCDDKVVLYFTSLRGIRRTYEDCCTVRLILRGFRVMVDERDISMDSSYRKELQSALGGKAMSLPQLFIRGKHVGGADLIKQMHETGELERLLDGFPVQDCGCVCDGCGDARFIPCSSCNGSRKVFLEEEGQTKKCPDCNENGLVRCPGCCS